MMLLCVMFPFFPGRITLVFVVTIAKSLISEVVSRLIVGIVVLLPTGITRSEKPGSFKNNAKVFSSSLRRVCQPQLSRRRRWRTSEKRSNSGILKETVECRRVQVVGHDAWRSADL